MRALFASQLAGDLLRVSGFASLVNAVFVGRTDDEEAQNEALRLLKVPTGVGYEQMLGTLSPRPRHDDRPDDTPRQFVFADGHGGVEKIRIDLEAPHLEHVREALDTNPDASRVSTRGVPARTTSAAVRAPDEPAPRPPVALAHDLGDHAGGHLGPGDDFADLDDPEGLLAADGEPVGAGPSNGAPAPNGTAPNGTAPNGGPTTAPNGSAPDGASDAVHGPADGALPILPAGAELLDDEELDLLGDVDAGVELADELDADELDADPAAHTGNGDGSPAGDDRVRVPGEAVR